MIDPSHPLWRKAIRCRDIRRIDGLIGMTLYRVRPGVTVNDRGFLTSTSWVLVNFETMREARSTSVTSVYAAQRTGHLYFGRRELNDIGGEISLTDNELRTVRGWDHKKALSNLEFNYTITKPRWAIGSAESVPDYYFWNDSGPTSFLMAKKFSDRSEAENFIATKIMMNPRLLGKLRIVNV